MDWVCICVSLVPLGTLVIFYSLFILAYMAICLATVFGTSLMADVGDGEAVCSL